MKTLTFLSIILSVASCQKQITTNNTLKQMDKTYLALGDSYTIGESVVQAESFPYQLVNALKAQGIKITDPQIIAVTGWTTDQLIKAIKEENLQSKYDVVTLLIGVNNQYRGYPQDTYRKEFVELLNTAVNYADGKKERVFVISIPDWGVTPFAKNSGRDLVYISKEIDEFNEINKEETLNAGITYIDITPGSRKAATDLSLLAPDGLHPSGKMYTEWVNQLAKEVVKSIK